LSDEKKPSQDDYGAHGHTSAKRTPPETSTRRQGRLGRFRDNGWRFFLDFPERRHITAAREFY